MYLNWFCVFTVIIIGINAQYTQSSGYHPQQEYYKPQDTSNSGAEIKIIQSPSDFGQIFNLPNTPRLSQSQSSHVYNSGYQPENRDQNNDVTVYVIEIPVSDTHATAANGGIEMGYPMQKDTQRGNYNQHRRHHNLPRMGYYEGINKYFGDYQPQRDVMPIEQISPNVFTTHQGSNGDGGLNAVPVQPSMYYNHPATQTVNLEPSVYDTPTTMYIPATLPKMDEEKLNKLLNEVFQSNEPVKENAGGKSLLELLSDLPPSADTMKSDDFGGDFGLDVRSESKRRKRSLHHLKDTIVNNLHGTIDKISDLATKFEQHSPLRLHHHHGGCHNKNHDHERGHYHEHHGIHISHEHQHGHNSNELIESGGGNYKDTDDSKISPSTSNGHNNDHFNSDNSGHSIFQTSSPSTPSTVTDYDIDVRSTFKDRRKREIQPLLTNRFRRADGTIVFHEDEEEKKFDGKPVPIKTKSEPKKSMEVSDESSTDATEEEDSENGELDSRFGFIGGRRRHRPLAGLISSIVNNVVHSPENERDYHSYPRPPPPYYPQHSNYNPPPQPIPPPQPYYPQESPQQNPYQHHQQQHPQQYYPQQQNAISNAQSQNYQNQFGQFQNNAGSAQSSNLAADGSAGQLASANTQQQSFQNEFGSGIKNSGQSQSANYDANGNLALTSSNSNVQHTQGASGSRDESNSGAQSALHNEFGTGSSGAQTDTQTFNENGQHGTQSHGSSQSLFHGNDGSISGSNSDATSGTFEGPFGLHGQQASSHASTFNNGGQGSSVSVSATATTGNRGHGPSSGSSASANSYNEQQQPFYYEGQPVF